MICIEIDRIGYTSVQKSRRKFVRYRTWYASSDVDYSPTRWISSNGPTTRLRCCTARKALSTSPLQWHNRSLEVLNPSPHQSGAPPLCVCFAARAFVRFITANTHVRAGVSSSGSLPSLRPRLARTQAGTANPLFLVRSRGFLTSFGK
jgi:hypothetical protein